MSDVCGIFYKSCPHCAVAVVKTATSCNCGYSFESDSPTSAIAQSWAEEKLYEDYLIARVAQTAQAAIDAQSLQAMRREDPALSAAVVAALEEAATVRSELSAQNARVEELRQAMVADAGRAALAPPVVVSLPTAAAVANTTATLATRVAPEAIPLVSARAAEVAQAAQALKAELAKLRGDTRTPAAVAQIPRRAPATHAREAAKLPEVPKKTCAQCHVAVLASAKRCRCGYAFGTEQETTALANVPNIEEVLARAEELKKSRHESVQAEKAARIHQARLARAAARPKVAKPATGEVAPAKSIPIEPATISTPAAVVAPVVRTTPAPVRAQPVAAPAPRALAPAQPSAPMAGRSIQHLSVCLAPARPIVAAARDIKECPNCTANVPPPITRCKCGFEFRNAAIGSPMPALRLDAGDVIKVRDLYLRR